MNITTFQIYDIPEHDKKLLRPYQDKAHYINELPKIMSERKNEYDMYFSTFTFTNFKSKIDYNRYHEFFRYFRQRLDNALLSNAKAYHKLPFLYLFPEEKPQTHFHGIVFIHKLTSDKFQNKCVLNIESEYSVKLAEHVSSIRLKNKFVNPYPKAITDKKILTIADYRIYPVISAEQKSRSASYSVKSFIPSRFTTDDIIVEAKEKS